jgi:energy-coupling factor transport system permease protein
MIPRINTWAWIAWLLSALILIARTRNPLYLAIIFLVIFILATRLSRLTGRMHPHFLVRLTLSFIVLSTIFNALFAHYGSNVVFTIPQRIPFLGGVITLEAMVFGAINGLVLAAIFGAFSVVSMALPARSIIRLVPRAFYPVAVVLSIALTFLPNTLNQFQQIREAQAVRGHRMRGWRDWLPLIMPLLIGGLERAINLSESMTARGFAATSAPQRSSMNQVLSVTGVLALLAGWVLRLQGKFPVAGMLMLSVGALLILGMLWKSGRSFPVTTYRRESWSWLDTAIVIGAAGAVIISVFLTDSRVASGMEYNPYPTLTAPHFSAWAGVAIFGLLVPLLAMKPDHNEALKTEKNTGENTV